MKPYDELTLEEKLNLIQMDMKNWLIKGERPFLDIRPIEYASLSILTTNELKNLKKRWGV